MGVGLARCHSLCSGKIEHCNLQRDIAVLVVAACLTCARCGHGSNGGDRFFESDGVPIRYQVSGQGPPVVLIHGFGQTLERWHSAGLVRALAPHFKVIALDVRGHGRSGKPGGRESYGAHLAADVVRLVHQVGAAKAHVVGYSMGALVALDVAALHPDLALSVVLGGAGLNLPEAVGEFERQAEAIESGIIPMQHRENAKALGALLRGLRVMSEEHVRRISVPMAVLIGADDNFMSDVQRLALLVPTVEVVVIPEANHATALDHPKFAEALLTFLRKQSGATP